MRGLIGERGRLQCLGLSQVVKFSFRNALKMTVEGCYRTVLRLVVNCQCKLKHISIIIYWEILIDKNNVIQQLK